MACGSPCAEQAIKKGNMEGAKIYAAVRWGQRLACGARLWLAPYPCSPHHVMRCAQNAIREKNQALNYLRLSSRIDAVSGDLV